MHDPLRLRARAAGAGLVASLLVGVLVPVWTARPALAASDDEEAQRIEIRADEFAYTPEEIHARARSPLWIVFRNEGQSRHNLTFPSIAQGTASIGPGEATNLRLTLERPGTYRFVCTMPGHSEAGLEGVLVLDGSGAGERDDDAPDSNPVMPGVAESDATARDTGARPRELPSDEEIARATAREAALRPRENTWTGGNPGRGASLYARHCNICHGASGKGDGPAAPALNPKPRDFSTGVFYLDANANSDTGEPIDLARVIRDGPAAFGGSELMQGFGETLSDQEIRHLVAFVRSLSGRGG